MRAAAAELLVVTQSWLLASQMFGDKKLELILHNHSTKSRLLNLASECYSAAMSQRLYHISRYHGTHGGHATCGDELPMPPIKIPNLWFKLF